MQFWYWVLWFVHDIRYDWFVDGVGRLAIFKDSVCPGSEILQCTSDHARTSVWRRNFPEAPVYVMMYSSADFSKAKSDASLDLKDAFFSLLSYGLVLF